jgi:hypothetical protein
MFLARGTRAPRCDRCGRIMAPYPSCRACSSLASAAAPDTPAAPESSIEDLIAAALPGASPDELFQPVREPVLVGEGARSAGHEPAHGGSYDPDDVSIPRDPDMFLGSGGGGRWRRMF